MECYLKQLLPHQGEPLIIKLTKKECLIGRKTHRIFETCSKMSRYHASLTKMKHSWYIKDLGSLNKTYVNFKEICSLPVKLVNGDIIGLGTSEIYQKEGFVCLFVSTHLIVRDTTSDSGDSDSTIIAKQRVKNTNEIPYLTKKVCAAKDSKGCEVLETICSKVKSEPVLERSDSHQNLENEGLKKNCSFSIIDNTESSSFGYDSITSQCDELRAFPIKTELICLEEDDEFHENISLVNDKNKSMSEQCKVIQHSPRNTKNNFLVNLKIDASNANFNSEKTEKYIQSLLESNINPCTTDDFEKKGQDKETGKNTGEKTIAGGTQAADIEKVEGNCSERNAVEKYKYDTSQISCLDTEERHQNKIKLMRKNRMLSSDSESPEDQNKIIRDKSESVCRINKSKEKRSIKISAVKTDSKIQKSFLKKGKRDASKSQSKDKNDYEKFNKKNKCKTLKLSRTAKSRKHENESSKKLSANFDETHSKNLNSSTLNEYNRPAPATDTRPSNYGSRSGVLSNSMEHGSNKTVNKRKRAHSENVKVRKKISNDIDYSPKNKSLNEPKQLCEGNFSAKFLTSDSGNVQNPSCNKNKKATTQNVKHQVFNSNQNECTSSLGSVTNVSTVTNINDGKLICHLASPIPSSKQDSCIHHSPNTLQNESGESIVKYTEVNKVLVKHNLSSYRTECSTTQTQQDFRELNLKSFTDKIISWNTKWLMEQKNNSKPPPEICKAENIPLWFFSYRSYVQSFLPMLFLEIWESMFRKYSEVNKEGKLFHYTILFFECSQHRTKLHCESIVNSSQSFLPQEGSIVVIGRENGSDVSQHMLGYIYRHEFSDVDPSTINNDIWSEIPATGQENVKLYKFSMCLKKVRYTMQLHTLRIAEGLTNLKPYFHIVNALRSFKTSPLLHCILKPNREIFNFNSIAVQMTTGVSERICNALMDVNIKDNVHLLYSPPGTGKTAIIIETLEKLLSKHTEIKILICASSESALDEIGNRLIEVNERCKSKEVSNLINFIRFGEPKKISSNLISNAFRNLVEQKFKEHFKREISELNSQKEDLQQRINSILFREKRMQSKYLYRKEDIETPLHQLMDELVVLKERSPITYMDAETQKTYEDKVLKESSVLLCTLDNAVNKFVRYFLQKSNDRNPHAVCIVDNANQCTELELLQCLLPEIKKLLIVGDEKQLPPSICSIFAMKCGYGKSLIERMYHYHKKEHKSNPPFALTVQYRMPIMVAEFISMNYYSGRLKASHDIIQRYKNFPLKPFLIYDIQQHCASELAIDPWLNKDSVAFRIAYLLRNAAPPASIAVIAMTEKQSRLYRDYFFTYEPLKSVEVDVVENFQGREKDIVIIICGPINQCNDYFLSSRKHLNAAISRCRHGLVIIGNMSSLSGYYHWAELVDEARKKCAIISVHSLRNIHHIFVQTIAKY